MDQQKLWRIIKRDLAQFAEESGMRLADPEGTRQKTYQDDQFIYVHESAIRVELGFLRKEPGAKPRQPFGFALAPDPLADG